MADRKEVQRKRRHRKRGSQKKWIVPVSIVVVAVIAAAGCFAVWKGFGVKVAPEDTVKEYFSLVKEGKYEDMYGMLSAESQKKISREDFITRNQNIYEGIEATDIKVKLKGEAEYKDGKKEAYVSYLTDMNTSADEISFENKMKMVKEEKAYRIDWDSTLIFPALKDEYKVQISTDPAVRGSILDRNGQLLAGQGTVSEVGIVPGKLGDNKEESVKKIADILGITADDINGKLGASYVQDDSFVPVKEIAKDNTTVEEQLLKIPGIMINDKEERVYPLGAAAGHLTGYVQSVTAEDLEKLKGKGYSETSVIGKAGLERALEDEIRAVDGHSIDIVDAAGVKIENLAFKPAQNGRDIKVTIDSKMQRTAYEQFSSDPGTAVAMNPKTGEVLTLVSTPGYDPNEFILGMSDKRWNELNDDKNKPLTNRWYTTWVPGSTFKAVTAAIGVDSGKIKPDENMGYVGLKWQKDAGWGDYFVTTLTDYGQEVNLENALVYSDNIYFARASLEIGEEIEKKYFKAMGFNEDIPFEMGIVSSTYDDDDHIDSDIQLADTGYGQGQLLVNPIHMLSMYTMFVNDGNMIQPTILYQDNPQGKVWKENVVSAETAEIVRNDLVQVIENPSGTGAKAKIDGLMMLGKTGTAEIKESQDDTTGVERGWFVCETVGDVEKPVVAAGMVEDVKDKGGSNYVTEKVREIVAAYE